MKKTFPSVTIDTTQMTLEELDTFLKSVKAIYSQLCQDRALMNLSMHENSSKSK